MMDIWIILNKLTVLIFYADYYIFGNFESRDLFIFSFLVYISLNLLMYIFNGVKIKTLLIIISIFYSLVCSYYINKYAILLFPISIYEFMRLKCDDKYISYIIGILPIFFIDPKVKLNYFAISTLSYFIFRVSYSYNVRIKQLEVTLDNMRKSKQRLSTELFKSREYIKQSDYTIKLEERNKLSQEIHDNIGHSVTGALIQMEAALALIDIDTEKSKKLINNSIKISRDGIEDIRKGLNRIKPTSEIMGINRLKLLAGKYMNNSNIIVNITYNGYLDKITYRQWQIIYENTYESLTNAGKYSGASKINVDISVLNKIIKVVIRDNGLGCLKIKKGLGISGMEERCATINSKLILDGTKGFSVTMLMPII